MKILTQLNVLCRLSRLSRTSGTTRRIPSRHYLLSLPLVDEKSDFARELEEQRKVFEEKEEQAKTTPSEESVRDDLKSFGMGTVPLRPASPQKPNISKRRAIPLQVFSKTYWTALSCRRDSRNSSLTRVQLSRLKKRAKTRTKTSS